MKAPYIFINKYYGKIFAYNAFEEVMSCKLMTLSFEKLAKDVQQNYCEIKTAVFNVNCPTGMTTQTVQTQIRSNLMMVYND